LICGRTPAPRALLPGAAAPRPAVGRRLGLHPPGAAGAKGILIAPAANSDWTSTVRQ
jgi:hypothetical protein